MGDFDNWKRKYLGFVDRVVRLIPYGRASQWKEFALDPLPFVSRPDTIVQRIKDIYVMQAVAWLLELVGSIPRLAIAGFILATYSVFLLGLPLLAVGALIGLILLLFLLGPFFTLAYCFLEYAVAKLLGGAGDYKTHFNAAVASSLAVFALNIPLLIVIVPLSWLMVIPCLGYLFLLLSLPIYFLMFGIGLYGLYLKFISYRKLHTLSDGAAATVVILPIVLLVLGAIVAIVMLYLGMFAFLFSVPMLAGAASSV